MRGKGAKDEGGAGSEEGVRERWGDGERDEGLGAMSLLSLSESVGGGER